MMHKRAYPIRSLLLFTAITLFLTGCDSSGGSPPPVYQTEILEVRVEPNPVVVGDTTLLTVIIRDSLDVRFEFIWVITGNAPFYTERNQLEWIADVNPGRYSAGVTVNNNDSLKQPAHAGFAIEVISDQ